MEIEVCKGHGCKPQWHTNKSGWFCAMCSKPFYEEQSTEVKGPDRRNCKIGLGTKRSDNLDLYGGAEPCK